MKPTLLAAALWFAPIISFAADDADLIVHNAKVVTLDAKSSIAEAVAVQDGKLSAVGTNANILKLKGEKTRVIDAKGNKITLPRGSSDAALMPYHVDRSKLYVLDRLEAVVPIDRERVARAVEGTRFPANEGQTYDDEAAIVRAADFIGQLGDPNYIRKANALYHEFEEVGINRQLGYESPADIVDRYPQFYWNMVAPNIQDAIRCLNMTGSGRQWIANLYGNVFRAEREIGLSGPQS